MALGCPHLQAQRKWLRELGTLLYVEESWQELVCLGTQTQTTSNMPPGRRDKRIVPRLLSHVRLLLDPESADRHSTLLSQERREPASRGL